MSNISFSIDHIEGQKLLNLVPDMWSRMNSSSCCSIPAAENSTPLCLTDDVMSKHILAMGSIGSGKSTFLNHVVRGITESSGANTDRFIFFDAKGDYLRLFKNEESVCIGYDVADRNDAWNLFADIMDTPDSPPDMELLRQIATTLFKKQIESSNNPTFPCGARDLFVGLVCIFIKREQRNSIPSFDSMNNAALKRFFDEYVTDGEAISRMLIDSPELAWLHTYLIAPKSATTQSYLAPLQTVVNDVFIGCFGRAGHFSIRRFMRGEGDKRRLFLEYDPEKGVIIDTVYTALLDLAFKESIGRSNFGNRYYILDEFPMIPALAYIGQALQFGRSLGVKVVAAIQNISQIIEKYGEAGAMNILNGFSTVFAFRLFDQKSREIVSNRHGKRLVRMSCTSVNYNNTNQEIIQELDVIADWNITSLTVGKCIVSPFQGDPFFFFPADYHPVQQRARHENRARHTMRIIS